jgi:microcystin-dependent protein
MKASNYFLGLVGAAFLVMTGVMVTNVFTPIEKVHAQLGAGSTWLGTAGGTANAIVIHVHNVSSSADLVGVPYRFLASASSTGTVTITYDLDSGATIGPSTLFRPTTNISYAALSNGEIVIGTIVEVTYSSASGPVLTSAVDMTPIGSVVMSRTSAMTGYLVEDGSCYSATQYAALYAVIGASYGNCGAGTFLVPDSRGTGAWATDNQGANGAAGRLTTAVCGLPDSVGVVCGANAKTLTVAQMPEVTSTGGGLSVSTTDSVSVSGSISGITTALNEVAVNAGSSVTVSSQNAGTSFAGLSVSGSFSGSGSGSGSGGTSGQSVSCNNCGGQPFSVLPTVSLMYRLIKY